MLGWPKSSFVFLRITVLVVLSCLHFIQNDCVRLYCESYHVCAFFKNLSKLANLGAAILILKMTESTHFQHIMC